MINRSKAPGGALVNHHYDSDVSITHVHRYRVIIPVTQENKIKHNNAEKWHNNGCDGIKLARIEFCYAFP